MCKNMVEFVSAVLAMAKNFFGILKDAKDLASREAQRKEPRSKQKPQVTDFEHLQMLYSSSENVYWGLDPDGNKLGPFCTYCRNIDGRWVPLNPGATRGTYSCPFHLESFRTHEYNPRPIRRRRFGPPNL